MEFRLRILALQCADQLWEFTLFSLQDYLTYVWGLSFTKAAKYLNLWGGIRRILPIFFLFIADTVAGNFRMLLISGLAYVVGMFVLTVSVPPVLGIFTGSCVEYRRECIDDTRMYIFLSAMILIGVGIAGQDASLDPFTEEQHQSGFLEYWRGHKLETLRRVVAPILTLIFPPVVALLVFPYIADWFLLYGVSTICMAFAVLAFISGSRTYIVESPQGSKLTVLCRVFAAAAFKITQPVPASPERFFNEGNVQFRPSRFLRWLEKAAIIVPGTSLEDQKKKRWKLCSLAEVECAKVVLRMVPIWTTFLMCAIVSSIGETYFVEEVLSMKSTIGDWRTPLQLILGGYFLSLFLFEKLAKRTLKTRDPYASQKGLVVAIIFSVLCCISAALVERMRLHIAGKSPPAEPVDMSAYWMFIPYVMLAGMEAFFRWGSDTFVTKLAPAPMIKYLECFNKAVTGVGFLCAVATIDVLGEVSKIGGEESWIQETLNASRMDKYYWVIASLSSLNLLLFIFVASFYRFDDSEVPTEKMDDDA